MKKLLLKTAIFCFAALLLFLLILSQADGHTDPFYIRFTSPKQTHLMIGTSRAAQGLQPSVFDSILNIKAYNYAFTVAHSPYGETYLNSIKQKLKETTSNGLFIVTVDPWSISSKLEKPNDAEQFRELDLCVGKTPFVNHKPNFIYLIRNLSGEYYKIFLQPKSATFLHDNGWLEVSVSMDSLKTMARTNAKVEDYRKNLLPYYKYSSLRFDYLQQTIEFLNQHGKVYLVRMPIHPDIMAIENELMADFTSKMEELAPMTEGYFDMTASNNQYQYVDGNHLFKDSGKIVSRKIAEWIKSIR